MATMSYPAVGWYSQEDEVWIVEFPDFLGGRTYDDTEAAVWKDADDCLDALLVACMHIGKDIPKPSPALGRRMVSPPALTAAKAVLWQAMRDAGVSNSELARRLEVTEAAVRRLVNPRHASRIDKLEAALAAVGRQLVIGEDAA